MTKRTSVGGVTIAKSMSHQKAVTIERAIGLYDKGFPTKEVGRILGINHNTIYKWRFDHPELKEVLKTNKENHPSGDEYAAAGAVTSYVAGLQIGGMTQDVARRLDGAIRKMMNGKTITDACHEMNVSEATMSKWRKRSPELDDIVEQAKQQRLDSKKPGLITRDKELLPKGTFAEFRMNYFGRPTLPHQEAVVRALEDRTNLAVIVLAPPGSGKDTIAGDWIAYELADDRAGLRVAWIMESEGFARRRLQRLGAYFTDPSVYKYQPTKTPGGARPVRSLIEDYGPYRWSKDLEFPDGTKPERRPWNQNQMYFVMVETPEADPNLWATGVDGATYGARIDVAVLSDPFTEENQISPTQRSNQMSFIEGTLDTRLDEGGRLIVLGTMLEGTNNYEKLIESYTTNARIIASDGIYTKYSNGTAVVIHPAITYPDGVETSYWEARFPLDPAIVVDGERFTLEGLEGDAQIELLSQPGAERLRGLRERRERNPRKFEAMYNQNRAGVDLSDFTDTTLAAAEDIDRTFGVVYPNEVCVLGVDPARVYGAGWVLWAVDTHRNRATIADFFYGEALGYDGIKQKLIVNPVTTYKPAWLVFEGNRHAAVLSDPVLSNFLDSSGVSVWTPGTTSYNRSSLDIGPASMTAFMRSKGIRIPYATSLDRKKAQQLKEHFQTWDRSSLRKKPGHKHHAPDDLAMAAWMGWLKIVEIMDDEFFGGVNRTRSVTRRPVPPSVERAWRYANSPKGDSTTRHSSPSIEDAISIMAGVEK